MRVAVIGAGIVGAATAYELASDGHAVTVFERCGSAAAEASFATGGLAAPGLVTPWAAIGTRFHARRDAGTAGWLWRWWRAQRAAALPAQRVRLHRLAAYSAERLQHLTEQLKLDHERSQGVLLLLRTPKALARAQAELKRLAELGVAVAVLDAAQCRAVEPGLNDAATLHAGLHFGDGEAGNCRQFALLLRSAAERLGARFRFHAEVERIVPGRPPQLVWRPLAPADSTHQAAANDGARSENFDAVVVCAAQGAAALLAPLGLRLPLLALHGYSVTAPMRHHDDDAHRGPRSALIDAQHGVTIGRLGARLRVSGGAEFGRALFAAPDAHDTKTLNTLYRVLNDWFPGVAQMGQAVRWKGTQTLLPDGPPVLGPAGRNGRGNSGGNSLGNGSSAECDGVWLNLGHGAHGWALACGSARVLADQIAGRPPGIDTEGLGMERLRR